MENESSKKKPKQRCSIQVDSTVGVVLDQIAEGVKLSRADVVSFMITRSSVEQIIQDIKSSNVKPTRSGRPKSTKFVERIKKPRPVY